MDELDEFQPHQDVPETAFLRFEIDCQKAGEIQFRYTAPLDAVSFWIDSLPEPAPAPEESLWLEPGVHRVVLGIDAANVGGSFGCELIVPDERAAVFDIR